MQATATQLTPAQSKMIGRLTAPSFRAFMAMKFPLAFIAGTKITHLDAEKTEATLPFKFLNMNPFKSTYFAAQAMAAELSTAASCLVAIEGIKPSVAFIIVNMEASFTKKAVKKLTFTCDENEKAFEAVRKCIETGQSETVKLKTIGRMPDGTEVSTFWFTWSFKQRSKK